MKKSNFIHYCLCALWCVLTTANLSAQTTVNMANTGAPSGSPFTISPPTTCSFQFYDSGGPAGNYNNNANAHVTFAPSNSATHRVQINFLAFALEEWDALYIYNSSTVGTNQVVGPQGATMSGFPAGNWQTISPGTITANTGIAAVGTNNEEALTVQLLSDPTGSAAGWSALVTQVPKVSCVMTIPANITVNTGPAASTCFVNVNSPVPTFAPGGCNASYILRYRLNGGVPVVVTDPATTTIPAPVGKNVVLWELIATCGDAVVSSGTQMITVLDNTAPIITCPSNTTLNLPPGACDVAFNYVVNCTDNCSFMMNGQVTHPIDFDNGQAGIMFDVVNLGFSPLVITEFGPSLDLGVWPIEVYRTSTAASWQGSQNNVANWQLLSSQAITSMGPGTGTPITGFSITLQPGESKGIYITSKIGAPINYTGSVATPSSRQFDDGKLRVSSAPGAGVNYPFGLTFSSRSYNGYVKYQMPTSGIPVQLSGVASGARFPLGETTNVFRCTDASGNTAICSFKVTVVPFPNPIKNLVCNDLVTVALDETCETMLGADEVLEGGPYKCYDQYKLELDKTPPFGNGPWVTAKLTSADIGKTYAVRVTDPATGNKCEGNIIVQDNLAPKMNCLPSPNYLPCNFPTDPCFSANASITQRFTPDGLPMSVVDNQIRTFEVPVTAPAGSKVEDLDLRLKLSGDAFRSNLRIQVESPTGKIVTVWDQLTGCGNSPILVRLDDEGIVDFNCTNYTTDKNAVVPMNLGQLATFDNESPNGIWKVRVSDVNAGADFTNIETIELYIKINGNYSAGLPNGIACANVTKVNANTYNVPAGFLDACGPVTLTFADQTMQEECKTGFTSTITRRWTARDASGNVSTCNQVIKLLRPALSDIVLPSNFDDIENPAFKCNTGEYPTPEWIVKQGLLGVPTLGGLPIMCSVGSDYTDLPIWSCKGSVRISREWLIQDFCTGKSIKFDQLIRVEDKEGPIIDAPANLTASTDPFACCATVDLPEVLVSDKCAMVKSISAYLTTIDAATGDTLNVEFVPGSLVNFPGNNPQNSDTLAVFNLQKCLPVGTHCVTYIATDDCDNTSSVTFKLKVYDLSPPVAACDQVTTISLGRDDPNDCYLPDPKTCAFAGVSWLKAISLDDKSYDNCGSVLFKAYRATPYNDCILALNKTNGKPDCSDNTPDAVTEYDRATMESDSIKFYCCEVGTTQDVILRVYQLDPDGSIGLYPDGTPIYNECKVKVEIQDKLKPQCDPPLNVTVSCSSFDPSLWAYGLPKVYDNCCLDTTIVTMGQKGLKQTVSYAQFDTLCNRGTIFRSFQVFDCYGASGQCQQRIIVSPDQGGNYAIKFPDDKVVTTCDGTVDFGKPEFSGMPCGQIAVSFTDETFNVVADACYKIERTWKIINWCNYNPNVPCISVPNPNPSNNSNSSANLPGPVVSKLGTPAPWAPTVVKVNPSDANTTNYSSFWNINANCYTYKQIIKVTDTQKPVINCPAPPIVVNDLSNNNKELWNDPTWWDLKYKVHDLCEMPVELGLWANDACSGVNIDMRYLLFLDLDGDGTMETVVNSANLPAPGTVNFGNANTQDYSGGAPRIFDNRQVPLNEKYQFAIEYAVSGDKRLAQVKWNTQKNPNTYVLPELPHGKHKIKWVVSDRCGNESTCEYEFTIKDGKPPTVFCINGLSANVMPNGLTLYASDFILTAMDNCAPLDALIFGIRKKGKGTGFPLDANGNPQISVTFDCTELGTQEVELWASDGTNAAYCETYIIVQDKLGNCSQNATIAGALNMENGNGLEEAQIEVTGQSNKGITFLHHGMTGKEGGFNFKNAVPMQSDYTLTPTKDENPLNGVSTYDLVLISKHILGIEPLGSPYKMIAADANRSGSITTLDIVELRKLILGIYQELPKSTSWRFVDEDFVFPNPSNPFEGAFPENKTVSEIKGSLMHEDFVAIKVGDVNASAVANSLQSAEDRSNGLMLFDVEDQSVKAGDDIVVEFTPTEQPSGYQFTLNINGLTILDVQPGENMSKENFGVLQHENALTTSWDGKTGGSFSVRFRATKTGRLSNMIQVSSRITKAEGYRAQNGQSIERKDIALRFNNGNTSSISGLGFELYQNMPNPFVNKTMIGFHLPEAGTATLRIYDDTGRLIHTQKGDYAKGYNSIPLERNKLQGKAGVLMYQLESATDTATKKMIVGD